VPFGKLVTSDGIALPTEINLMFSIAPVLIAAGGILLARNLYMKESNKAQKISESLSGLYRAAYSKFYIDELYLFFTKKVVFNLVGRPAAWVDRNVVDGAMNGIASVTSGISGMIKKVQSGNVQSYAVYFFAGAIGFALIFIYLMK